jgi:hypothetical protein
MTNRPSARVKHHRLPRFGTRTSVQPPPGWCQSSGEQLTERREWLAAPDTTKKCACETATPSRVTNMAVAETRLEDAT